MGKRWLPLEANPDVLNEFAKELGLEVSQCSFHDVYGLDTVSMTLLKQMPQFQLCHRNVNGLFTYS